jgi:hypothetical protein
MPWSDEKFWTSTQLPTVNRHRSSKQRMQMWTSAPLTDRQAPWPALQLANPVDQSSNTASSMRQGQLVLGADNTKREKARWQAAAGLGTR